MTEPAGYRGLVDAAGTWDRGLAVFEAVGADTITYLHGQVSADMEAIDVGGGARSLVLTPQGKLIAVVRFLRVGADRVLGLVAAPHLAPTVEALDRFKIRVDVTIEPIDGLTVQALRGPEAETVVTAAFGAALGPADLDHVEAGGVRIIRVATPGMAGFDILAGAPVALPDPAVTVSRAALDARRVEAGVLEFGVDFGPGVIPHDAGLVPWAVSLDKGCYVGQELIERVHSRGHANRHPRQVRLPSDASTPSPGVEVLPWVGDADTQAPAKSLGELTTTAWCPAWDAPGGLGLLRREVGPGDAVSVAGVPASVVE